MPVRSPPTANEVDMATRATITGLKKMSLDCCLVGSVACSAYGMSRTPADVDMLVLTTPTSYTGSSPSEAELQRTQEVLKNKLIELDSRFYTVASKDPYATYRVLWFRIPSPTSTSSLTSSSYAAYSSLYSLRSRDRSCKVDLLLPGVMNIPFVPKESIYRTPSTTRSSSANLDPLPLMPFLPLLLLKLQAWQDHGESPKSWMREKQPIDVRDITQLLEIAVTKYCPKPSSSGSKHSEAEGQGSRLKTTLLEKESTWLPDSFIRAGKTRVKKFVGSYPSTKAQWKMIGFDVDRDRSDVPVRAPAPPLVSRSVPLASTVTPTTRLASGSRSAAVGSRRRTQVDGMVKMESLMRSLEL
ncbi:hypothetical protein D9758_016816 [Tetrapyrgos nigripes]|uniref:Uncharacterized protein n=1 Tax=Tetrapyrgos nigripes TaxID=182062 RepID=A0A8H5BTE9_9AGAR|nr:hypothetical protein D9758_016816 [Tetrapyrgos nigripes]